jgi:competence protein ComEC
VEPSAVRRPAIYPALCCLAGIGLGIRLSLPVPVAVLAIGTLVLIVASLSWRSRAAARPVVGLALLVLGLLVGARDVAQADRRARGYFPPEGRPVELSFEGRTLRVLRLRVAASPEAPTWALDELRAGDRVRVWCRVRVPHPFGNPGASDPRGALASIGVDAVGHVKSARLVEALPGRGSPARRSIDEAVLVARRRLDRALGPGTRSRALLGAMLLGDRAGLSPEIQRRLRNAGMVHLVAISGLHVGLLLLIVLGVARRSGLGRGLCLVAAFLLLPSFAIAVGGRASVLRASLALLVALSGRWIGRDGDGRNSLALVAAGMALFRPALLLDPGFKLSFLATAGIVVLTRILAARIPAPSVPAAAVALSLAAYLATAPVVAHHFG